MSAVESGVHALIQPQGPLTVDVQPPADAVDLSIVLPTFNESRNIVAVIEQLSAALRQLGPVSFEIIVVDDDSPDGTWQLAARQAAQAGYEHVRVMRRQKERGLATAVIRGWQVSRGRVLGVMDADLQHPPEVMPQLFAAITAGASLAIGSRAADGGGVSDWSVRRRVVSRTAQLLGLLILPEILSRVGDPLSGCFLVRRSAFAGAVLRPRGYKILIEVLARASVRRIAEVGYVFRERQLDQSKVSSEVYRDYIWHLLQLRIELLLRNTFVRFCLVGSCGVLVDMLTLYLLSDPATLHWGLTRSKIIGGELALISNFLMNDAFTFAARIGADHSARAKFRRFLRFNALCGLGLLVNVLILNVLFNWLGVNRYVANAIAILLVTIQNYTLNLKLGWPAPRRR
jgi:dolichol-phosphate mannosyltransferase